MTPEGNVVKKRQDYEVVRDGETYTGRCLRPFGCGGFTSSGHETKKLAQARMAEHLGEHERGGGE